MRKARNYFTLADAIMILITIFLLVLLSSCRTVRATENHKTMDVQTVHVTHTEDHLHDTSTMVSGWVDSLMSHMTIHIRVYDTSKEVETASGKPPLLAEIDIESDLVNVSQSNEEQTIESIGTHIETDSIADATKVKNDNKTDIETKSAAYRAMEITMLVLSIGFVFGGLIFYFKE